MEREYRPASREISMAGICLHVGDQELGQILGSEKEHFIEGKANILAAYSMWIFGLEATMNILFSRLLSQNPEIFEINETKLEDVYWLTLKEKIVKFFEFSGENAPDFGRKPFQAVDTMKQVRDSVVHGKPSVTRGIALINSEGRPEFENSQIPLWQRECNINSAKKYREDIEKIINTICELNNGSLGKPSDILEVVHVDQSPISKIQNVILEHNDI